MQGFKLACHAIAQAGKVTALVYGQPLAATIKVTGIDKKMTSSCFTITSDDTNAIREVGFQLNQLGNGDGLLTLTSKRPVYEPIALLTVVSQCDTTFTRQYSLLIDPSATGDLVQTDNQDELNNQTIEALRLAESTSNSSNDVTTSAAAPSTLKAKKSRAASGKTINNQQLKPSVTTRQTDNNKQQAKVAAQPETVTTKPQLTISGGNLNSTNVDFSVMKLNFDKKINLHRATNQQTYAAEAISDELTVMNNRLTHLDKQLTSLQTQNAVLKQSNGDMQLQLTQVNQQNDFLRMLALSLGGGLLASAYFFSDWIRRRNAALSAEKEQALWQAMQDEQAEGETEASEHAMNDDFSSKLSNDMFKVDVPNEIRVADNTYAFQSSFSGNAVAEIVEETSNIKEDAELFLAHGRTGLAITLLQNHLMESPKESASTWMFLLDLLAKEGMQDEFESTAIECRKHFNVQLNDYSTPLNDGNTLESFERISLQLQKVWGTAEAISFLDELIYNSRLEPRMGFEKAVFEEILLLREIAHEEIRLAEVIAFNAVKSPREQKEEKMTIHLPEIEMSPKFIELGRQFSLQNEDTAPANPVGEHFEFELLDIAHR